MSRREDAMRPHKRVEAFNASYGVGTLVLYWRGLRSGPGQVSATSAPAEVICGAAVVWLRGVGGFIALSHVEPITGAQLEALVAEHRKAVSS